MVIRKQTTSSPCEPPSTTTTTTTGITRRKHRYPVDQSVDHQSPTPEDHSGVGCSGKSCRSCTAGVIADCVAVCCCPCAVINFFTLTFLKLPWMMARKCFSGLGNKKKKKKKLKNDDTEKDRSGISRKDEGVERKNENNLEEEEEVEKEEYSARFEAEKVWLELYKIDHLGFGRVSFTGIQSLE